MFEEYRQRLSDLREDTAIYGRIGLWLLGFLLLLVLGLMLYWSDEPDLFDVRAAAEQHAREQGVERVPGYVTTATLLKVAETLLDKPGGYLSNDRLSPALLLDNMPNWEFGVLVQCRDLVQSLRNDMSRSQSQSTEDKDLLVADPRLHFDSDSWLLPSTESEYRKGLKALDSYLRRLADPGDQKAQFFTRADNLRNWLAVLSKRMGSLSQRLSASVGQVRLNTDLQGDPEASQSTASAAEVVVKTPWTEIDDVFYEARGSAWALIAFLRAVEIDFDKVLNKKNALVSLRQIVRELEPTQDTVWSPVILNGTGFGMVANHSLVMASYISRANAALIDLMNLLEQG